MVNDVKLVLAIPFKASVDKTATSLFVNWINWAEVNAEPTPAEIPDSAELFKALTALVAMFATADEVIAFNCAAVKPLT